MSSFRGLADFNGVYQDFGWRQVVPKDFYSLFLWNSRAPVESIITLLGFAPAAIFLAAGLDFLRDFLPIPCCA